MKPVALALLFAACAEPPAAPPPPAPSGPPPPINVDDCLAPDCPYVGAAAVAMRDDDIAETMLPVAVNGIDQIGYVGYGDNRTRTDVTGAWTKVSDDGEYVHVRGITAGSGDFLVTAFTPYHDTEVFAQDELDLDVLPVASAALDLPRYVPLEGPIAPVVLGTSFTMAVRLLSADGRRLVDTTLATDGTDTEQTNWNWFAGTALAPGHHAVTVTADSLAQPAALAFDTIAHLDEIRTTDVREPGATYYHLVCAHALAAGHEVFSEWKMTATNANGWIPADAGNCLEVVPGNGDGDPNVATVTFVAADGTTAHLDVTE